MNCTGNTGGYQKLFDGKYVAGGVRCLWTSLARLEVDRCRLHITERTLETVWQIADEAMTELATHIIYVSNVSVVDVVAYLCYFQSE